MNKSITLLVLFLSLFSSSAAVEWEEIKCDVKAEPTAFFQSGDTIYIGNYGIAKSTDGGKSFKHLNKVLDGDKVRDLQNIGLPVYSFYITEQGTVLAFVRNYGILYLEENDSIWHLSDCFGVKFDRIDQLQFFEMKNEIYFINLNTNYIPASYLGLQQKIFLYKSENEGKTWETIDYKANLLNQLFDIKILEDKNLLAICGTKNNYIHTVAYFNPVNKSYESVYTNNLGLERIVFIEDKLYSISEEEKMLYVSEDYGKNWEKSFSLLGKNDSLDYILNHNYSKFGLSRHKSSLIISLGFIDIYFSEYNTTTFKSDNGGASWQLIDMNNPASAKNYSLYEILNNSSYSIIADKHNSNIYTVNKKNIGRNTLSASINRYRKLENSEIISADEELYIRKEFKWDVLNLPYQFYLNFDGSAYLINNDSLYYFDSFLEIINTKDIDLLTQSSGYNLSDIELNSIQSYWDSYFSTSRNAILKDEYSNLLFYKNKHIQHIPKSTVNIKANKSGDYIALCRADYSNLQLIAGNYHSKKTRLISNKKNKNFNYLNSFEFNDSVIAYDDDNGIQISRDFGKTWYLFLESKNKEWEFKIHKQALYLKHINTLLRSHDCKYWENILEGTSKARIIDFEFDPDGHAYVYTTNGAFISKEPTEDSGKAWNEDDIDLEFKLSSNKNLVEITSKDNIKNVRISDLDRELQQISDYTYDISNLDTANYFIRIEFEDGKVVYKQLALEEKE